MRVVVVGGGISGLTAAYRLKQRAEARGVPFELTVFEADTKLGGTIQTLDADGFLVESGPNGFLDSKPEAVTLSHDLGIGDRLLPANGESNRRWLLVNGALEPLPETPQAFLKSKLLTWGGKMRVACEPFIRARRDGADESVGAFARRRLGAQVAARLIDPFVSGIFAGDSEKLSVGSAFPRLVELEQQYGSLILASRSLAKARKRAGGPEGAAAGPSGRLTSFPLGMCELIHALGSAISGSVRLGERVTYLRRTGEKWVVGTDPDTAVTDVDVVVLAVPAYVAARLLSPLDTGFVAPLTRVQYAPVSVVALGFERAAVAHPLDGFGFLIPSSEGRRILGCLFDSTVYTGRAPEGHVLLRTMVGGARNPKLALLDDDELVSLVRSELDDILSLSGTPTITRIIRWTSAIPQYELGHRDKVAALDEVSARWPGLIISGNALHGVAVGDCAREGLNVAKKVFPDEPLALPPGPGQGLLPARS